MYAVVTGANRGMGLEICRRLASNGVMVVLTARDEKKGIEALEKLKENGLSDLVVFHQLDVLDPSTIASLADFIQTQFGRLDILVNNAAIGAITFDTEALKASAGVGSLTFPPLLGSYRKPQFMKDFKEDQLEAKNWPTYLSAYILSKAAMHAYMRILAKTHPFLMINCVCPGYVKTNSHTGLLTVEKGASRPKAAKLKCGHHLMTQTYSLGEECLEINNYGVKRMIGALIPLLDFSDSPRIVNVSSSSVKLKGCNALLARYNPFNSANDLDEFKQTSNQRFVPNEWTKGVFLDNESLTEERIEAVLDKFMKDFKEGELKANCWPSSLSAYTLVKASLNAYMKILAKRHTRFIVNSIYPGYVKTYMNCNIGNLTVVEGSENIVRLALLPEGGPSGLFF
ncbi:unnamed protein product [Camellia sinensis]